MIEEEAVEIFVPTFKYPQPKVARTALKINLYYKSNRTLVLSPLKFNALVQHQLQALIYSSVAHVFIGIHELAEKLGFFYLL